MTEMQLLAFPSFFIEKKGKNQNFPTIYNYISAKLWGYVEFYIRFHKFFPFAPLENPLIFC